MNFYVFICLDGVPIFELLLNRNFVAIENFDEIDWKKIKYIILNFKSNDTDSQKLIEKGQIQKENKILTTQIYYYQISIQKIAKVKKQDNLTIKERNIITFAKKIFFGEPEEFLKYVKTKRLFSKKDIHNFELAMQKLNEERNLIHSWNKIEERKK